MSEKAMKAVEIATKDVTLRPRRQLTLPAEVCDVLGLEAGDRLELSVGEGGLLVVKPKKAIALETLREIQKAFSSSDIIEEELQGEGKRVRERLSRRRYGEN